MRYVGYANKVTATCCNGSLVNFFYLALSYIKQKLSSWLKTNLGMLNGIGTFGEYFKEFD